MLSLRDTMYVTALIQRRCMLSTVFIMAAFFLFCGSRTSLAFQAQFRSLNRVAPFICQQQQRRASCLILSEKPKWLEEAMGNEDDGDEKDKEVQDQSPSSRLSEVLPLSDGLSGFSVDPEMGFCAILSQSIPSSNKDQSREQQFFHVVVSPSDKERLQSAEALTMVQLAGGLDLGTAIVPPDSLAKIVANQLEEDNEEKQVENGDEIQLPTFSSEDLRQRITLLRIEAVPNSLDVTLSALTLRRRGAGRLINASENSAEGDYQSTSSKGDEESTQSDVTEDHQTKEARHKAIQEKLPQILNAVKGLPGLAETTTDQIESAMKRWADEAGALDRSAFSNLLDDLRRQGGVTSIASDGSPIASLDPIKLVMLVTIGANDDDTDNQTPSILQVDAPSIFLGLALSMRYKVPVVVDERCFELTDKLSCFDADEILAQFPLFRPLRELLEDAKAMDGFIPSMYQKAKDLDNEDKQ